MNDRIRHNATQLAEMHGLRVVAAESLVAQFRKAGWNQQNHRDGIRLYCYGQAIASCGGRQDHRTEQRREGWLGASAWCFENGVTTAEKVAVEKGWVKAQTVRPAPRGRQGKGEA